MGFQKLGTVELQHKQRTSSEKPFQGRFPCKCWPSPCQLSQQGLRCLCLCSKQQIFDGVVAADTVKWGANWSLKTKEKSKNSMVKGIITA